MIALRSRAARKSRSALRRERYGDNSVDRPPAFDAKARRFDQSFFIPHCNAAVDKHNLSNGK
jgi:hypothetical protein